MLLANSNCKAGLVHNDLRHFNTMVDKECNTKIIDLGISSLAKPMIKQTGKPAPGSLCVSLAHAQPTVPADVTQFIALHHNILYHCGFLSMFSLAAMS